MPWTEEQHYEFGEGIYRTTPSIDPKFPDAALYNLENMVYNKESDNPEFMYGSTRIGTTDMGGTVTGLFDYKNGTKLVAGAQDGLLYTYTASDWAAGTGARATGNNTDAGTRWSGVMFYGATTAANILILANNSDDDDPVKYDGTNFTDLEPGSQSVPLNGRYPVVWLGRLWLFDGSTAYYSAPDDAEDFRVASGGGSFTVGRGYDEDITGATVMGQSLFIFKRSTTFKIAPVLVLSNAFVETVSTTTGCIAHNTIQEAGPKGVNNVTWMSEHAAVMATPSDTVSTFRPRRISRNVKPIFDEKNTSYTDRSWALWNADRMEYLLYFPTGSATDPSRGLLANFARAGMDPRWTQVTINSLTAGVVFVENNTDYIQYVGDTRGRVYKMHDSDVTTWAGTTYSGRVRTKFYVQGRPQHMKKYGWTFVAGQTSGNYVVTVRQVLLRPGLPTYGGNSKSVTVYGSGGWGSGKWGAATWGGTGALGERIRPTTANRGVGMQVSIEASNWFRLNGITIASAMKGDRIAA